MNVTSLDFNLIVALDALLRERSVTRAAAGMGLGQPALSMALRRLRRHFGDELLTRVGNSYELTPLALQLREPAAIALASVERVFASSPAFDPATTRRQFHLLCSDHTMALLGPAVSGLLSARAPGASLRLSQPRQRQAALDPAESTALREVTLRQYDAIVAPHGIFSNLPHLQLWSDNWVALVSSHNDAVGTAVTQENLAELPWVIFDNEVIPSPPLLQLLDPTIHAIVESFLALPFYVADSNRIALLPSRLASQWAARSDLRVVPLAGATPPITQGLWWHPTYEQDPEHAWFRSLVSEASHLTKLAPRTVARAS